jgi:iron complex outermembrane receptor protein
MLPKASCCIRRAMWAARIIMVCHQHYRYRRLTGGTLPFQALYNHKQLKGFNGNTYTSQADQLNVNTNNQFTIAKIYTAELSGFYTTRARNDIQEQLYPTGQLSLGISRPILKKRATLKFSARDIFYTNAMEGLNPVPQCYRIF